MKKMINSDNRDDGIPKRTSSLSCKHKDSELLEIHPHLVNARIVLDHILAHKNPQSFVQRHEELNFIQDFLCHYTPNLNANDRYKPLDNKNDTNHDSILKEDEEEENGDNDESSDDEDYWDTATNQENDNPYIYQGEQVDNDDGEKGGTRVQGKVEDVEVYECVIVGAGAAGIGVAIALLAGGMLPSNLLIVEKYNDVGHSFQSWNPHTQFITPSWPHSTKGFGALNLNDICPPTRHLPTNKSSCYHSHESENKTRMFNNDTKTQNSTTIDTTLKNHQRNTDWNENITEEKGHNSALGYTNSTEQHPTGRQYAKYLRHIAKLWKLPISFRVTVIGIDKVQSQQCSGFKIRTQPTSDNSCFSKPDATESNCHNVSHIYSKFVIWCGGEWQYPRERLPMDRYRLPESPEDSSTSTSYPDPTVEDSSPFILSSHVHYSKLGNDWYGDWVCRARQNRTHLYFLPKNDETKLSQSTDTVGSVAVVVGAGEAGIDTACELLRLGIDQVIIVDSNLNECMKKRLQEEKTYKPPISKNDPSFCLAPISIHKLQQTLSTGKLILLPSHKCVSTLSLNNCPPRDSSQAFQQQSKNKEFGKTYKPTELFQAVVTPLSRTKEPICLDPDTTDVVSSDAATHIIRKDDINSRHEIHIQASIPIIFCTGFDIQCAKPIYDLLEWNTLDKTLLLDPSCDESTKTSGLFVCGPMLEYKINTNQNVKQRKIDDAKEFQNSQITRDRSNNDISLCPPENQQLEKEDKKNDNYSKPLLETSKDKFQTSGKSTSNVMSFCFIYKFRTRFALVAGEILSRLIYQDHCERDGNFYTMDLVGEKRLKRVEQMLQCYKDCGMLLTDIKDAFHGIHISNTLNKNHSSCCHFCADHHNE